MSLKSFFQHIKEGIKSLWQKEPQVHQVVIQVIEGIHKASTYAGSAEADIIAQVFPNGIGTKTLAEVKVLLPEISEISTIADDALKASEGVEDPTEKANAVITTTLNKVAALPGLQKESHLLIIISALVSKVLHISYTEATHLVTAKQQELAHEAQG